MPNTDASIEVTGLRKVFPGAGGGVVAVDDVSFTVPAGQTLGLIGESGSGKSTTGRMIMGLEKPTAGSVTVGGTDITTLSSGELRVFRKTIQMVFQDSGSAFNPRLRVGDQIARSFLLHGMGTKEEARTATLAAIERVGLLPDQYERYIHEFSGGQRQRLGIARALITRPTHLVLDEPTAALDVSVQAQVLNLLKDLQAENGLTMLLITHNLALVEFMCESAVLLSKGRIAEEGPVDDLLRNPSTETTRTLIDSVLEPQAA
ncbi:ABC transporter ATP-binding protein [Brevibacterium litoralis]|uniref:ABC transporter ATP-binding protein n=1 Tax=Brevibacterium litoralis TaxID=3138935 RepID=UPI0032EB5D6F